MINECCPLCKSSEFNFFCDAVSKSGSFKVVMCIKCCNLYTLVLKPVNTHELYSDEVYQVVENRDSIFDKILSWEYGKVIVKLNSLCPNKGFLLDFGAGKGKFCSLAQKEGWNVRGVETALNRAAYAKEVYHINVYTQTYDGGQIFDGVCFDVVTLFHVLEHVTDPKNLLTNLTSANLKKNGILVIEVPNINSWQARLAKEHWIHLDVPRHVQHFTPDHLVQMLEDLNFKVLSTKFWSFHLGVLGMIDSLIKLMGYNGNIIYDLKSKKNYKLILLIIMVLPIAVLLESIAAITGNGGVIRTYSIHNNQCY